MNYNEKKEKLAFLKLRKINMLYTKSGGNKDDMQAYNNVCRLIKILEEDLENFKEKDEKNKTYVMQA